MFAQVIPRAFIQKYRISLGQVPTSNIIQVKSGADIRHKETIFVTESENTYFHVHTLLFRKKRYLYAGLRDESLILMTNK